MRFNQPTETVRVPVSSRPIVWAVVGGSQRCPTSSSVSPLALRTSRIRVIMQVPHITRTVFHCPTVLPLWQVHGNYILDLAGAKLLNRKGYEPDEMLVTP